jgi:hypothetical protein
MRIKRDGNVGIGTTSPSAKLEVDTSLAGEYGTYIHNQSSTGKGLLVKTNNDTSSDPVLWVGRNNQNPSLFVGGGANGGNVGIGTTSPNAKLVVADGMLGSLSQTALEFIPQDSNNRNIIFSYDRSGGAYKELNFDASNFKFNPGGSTKVVIDTSGNVGIGTTSPSKKLHVVGDELIYGNLYLESTPNGFRQIAMNTSDGADNQSLYLCGGGTASVVRGAQVVVKGNEASSEGGSAIIQAGRVSTGDIIFKTGVTVGERMRIDEAGNVGIGTASPTSKLEVAGGDIELSDIAGGITMISPDGTRYRITVANGGTLTVTAV